tara:strand:- start:637 stop:1512 length:876 start_codon:yes stop_codon:yes gene_type:complete
MKNISILLGLLLVVTSCADPDNLINDVLDNYTNGAVIRTISSSGEYNFYAPDTSVFTATIEEHDTENGALMQDIEISVSFNSGPEKLIQTLLPSDFTTGPTGLPRTDISVSLGDAMTALGLSSSQYTGGDAVNINLKLNLTDGRSFGADQATGSMTGSYFKSPYRYAKIIKCIPLVAVPGIYTFNMADSYGDGWQGGGILVTVDGYATKYGIPDDGDTTGLETFTGNNSSGYSTLTIPIGASTMEFSWVNDTYNSECSFNVVYTELDGTNEQTALNVSVVSAGTKTLSICR